MVRNETLIFLFIPSSRKHAFDYIIISFNFENITTHSQLTGCPDEIVQMMGQLIPLIPLLFERSFQLYYSTNDEYKLLFTFLLNGETI